MINNKPLLMHKVAIVMPVHNAEKFIKKTVQCILDQTFSNWVLLAIDDGSTDASVQILKGFTDPRIKVFSNDDSVKLKADHNGVIVAVEKNTDGPASARNRALDAIKYSRSNGPEYDYVAYCDSDDRWMNNHLFVTLNKLHASTDIDMVYTDCDFSKEDGTTVTTFGVPYYDKFDRENLLKQNFIYISTVVHKANLEVDNFDSWCVPMEDYDMWLRISKKYKVEHIQTLTATYMYKDAGSYYTSEQSAKSKVRVHLKNEIYDGDIQQQLELVKELKNELVKSQKYDEAAKLRDIEKTLLKRGFSPDKIEGWLSIVEGEALAMYGEGKDCLEIGSFKGKSANYIAPNAKSLVCIDPFRADNGGQTQYVDYTTLQDFLKNVAKFNNITPVIGKSEEVYTQFKDQQFDMIFIDGMHDYDSVVKDIKCYWPKLKTGGHMCFHDYQKDWNGVIKAVDEFFIRPDALHDSVAVVQKKYENLERHEGESMTLKEQFENKFLLMKYLNMSSEEIDKMDFYKFEEFVRYAKEKVKNEPRINPDIMDALVDSGANVVTLPESPRVIKKVVLVSPWSHKLPTGKENPKNFPYWTELVSMMKASGCYVIQIGISGEKLIGADEVVLNASFDRLKTLLDNADTFLSVDSFFPHFAHYHGKYGIVIFSQSDPNIFGYPENLNVLKSRDYLRKEQFWLWTQAEFNETAFISSKEVLDKVLETLQLQ
jgi:glycosyltransferase involved in cell wall biosynthesis